MISVNSSCAHPTPGVGLLAISQSSRGLGLVACLEGQNGGPNMASRKFSYIPKVICAGLSELF